MVSTSHVDSALSPQLQFGFEWKKAWENKAIHNNYTHDHIQLQRRHRCDKPFSIKLAESVPIGSNAILGISGLFFSPAP